jgi:hypothetical protein
MIEAGSDQPSTKRGDAMKAKFAPIYFHSADDPDFARQVDILRGLLADEAEILAPVGLGEELPECDGVIFPQMLGEAYRRLEQIKALPQPLMVITSEFGTVSMWDWEINSYLAAKGVTVIAPNSLEKTKMACRAFALKRQLRGSKFLVYQDQPASGGKQDAIFKRFYWWEPECIHAIQDGYGLKVIKKSFKKMAEDASAISDAEAEAAWAERNRATPVGRVTHRAILSAMKTYMAVKRDLDQDPSIIAVGINCLNESQYSDTTPCLAWNLLYEEQRMVWGCEADIVSMLTEVLVSKTISAPFMMTNMYPFLMGQAALKHENIPYFPEVDAGPENHILAAHCGYLGVLPQSFSTEWALREKVLAIVDDNATAIDARLPVGEITLVKLVPPFDRLSVIEGELRSYAQFENSDCLNGAVMRVTDGKKMVDALASHHYIVTVGHNQNELEMVAKVFGIECMGM